MNPIEALWAVGLTALILIAILKVRRRGNQPASSGKGSAHRDTVRKAARRVAGLVERVAWRVYRDPRRFLFLAGAALFYGLSFHFFTRQSAVGPLDVGVWICLQLIQIYISAGVHRLNLSFALLTLGGYGYCVYRVALGMYGWVEGQALFPGLSEWIVWPATLLAAYLLEYAGEPLLLIALKRRVSLEGDLLASVLQGRLLPISVTTRPTLPSAPHPNQPRLPAREQRPLLSAGNQDENLDPEDAYTDEEEYAEEGSER